MKNIKKIVVSVLSARDTLCDEMSREHSETGFWYARVDVGYIRCDNRTIQRLADELGEWDIPFLYYPYPVVNPKATYRIWIAPITDDWDAQRVWGLERVSYVVETEKVKAEVLTTQKRKRRRA